MDIEQILRLIQNLIRTGVVHEVKHSHPARIRVATGNLVTNWLPWMELRAGMTTTWNPPTVGEQVVMLAPGGDLTGAIALTGVNSDAVPPPSNSPNETVVKFPDSAISKYDHSSGTMDISGIKSLNIQAANSVTIKTEQIVLDAQQTTSTGKHTIEGMLSYLAGLSGENGEGGTTAITGDFIHQGGKLESNGIVLHLHVHYGVLPGDSDSGGPK